MAMEMSPRISFSQDFIHKEAIPVEQRRSHSRSSSLDFEFCVGGDEESVCSADEMFCEGKIVPLQISNRQGSCSPCPPILVDANGDKKHPSPPHKQQQQQQQASPPSKSFWHFKRSSSCGSGTLCPLPPLLSRSHSTGSKRSSLRNASSKNSHSQTGCHKPPPPPPPPFKKLQLNPLLNLHSRNLFGLASIFSSSASANKK